MEIIDHIVDYNKYCDKCKYGSLQINDKGEEPEPCNTCLSEPVNEYSKKPTKYEPIEKIKQGKDEENIK